jgi:MFS family permease
MPNVTIFGIVSGLVIATSIFVNIYLYATQTLPDEDKTYSNIMIAVNAFAGLLLITFLALFVVQRFQSGYYGYYPLLLILGILAIFILNVFASNKIYGKFSCMLYAVNFALMSFSAGLMLAFVYYFIYAKDKLFKISKKPKSSTVSRSNSVEMTSINDQIELQRLREQIKKTDLQNAVSREFAKTPKKKSRRKRR